MQKQYCKRSVTFSLILLVVVFSVISCSLKDKEIPMETFVNIYVDLVITKGMASVDGLTDSILVIEKETIYKKYDVTEAQIRNTIEFYNKDVHKWKAFYEAVTRKLEELQKSEEN